MKVAFDTEVKRFYLPGQKVTGVCPACGKVVEHDLGGQHYLNYPRANEPFPYALYHECPKGQDEVAVQLVLKIELEQLP